MENAARRAKGRRESAAEIGERLNSALEDAGMSGPELQAKLAATGVDGASRSNVFAYLQGKVEPGVRVLMEAARELRVRVEWLATGDGPRTEAEARLRWEVESALTRGPKAKADPHRPALAAALGPFNRYADGRVVQEVFHTALHLALYNEAYAGTRMGPAEASTVEATGQVARYLRSAIEHAPSELLEMEPHWLNVGDFMVLACQAYKRLIPTPRDAAQMRGMRALRAEQEAVHAEQEASSNG